MPDRLYSHRPCACGVKCRGRDSLPSDRHCHETGERGTAPTGEVVFSPQATAALDTLARASEFADKVRSEYVGALVSALDRQAMPR